MPSGAHEFTLGFKWVSFAQYTYSHYHISKLDLCPLSNDRYKLFRFLCFDPFYFIYFYKHTVPLLLRTGYLFEVTCMMNWLANINITYDEPREDINEIYFSLYVTVMVNQTRKFLSNKRYKKPTGQIKNGQSRNMGNIEPTRNRTKKINVRENRRGNQEQIIQRNGKH